MVPFEVTSTVVLLLCFAASGPWPGPGGCAWTTEGEGGAGGCGHKQEGEGAGPELHPGHNPETTLLS